jgi:hypothetical protein
MEKKTLQKLIEWNEIMVSLHRKEIENRYKDIQEIEIERQKLNDKVLDIQRSMAPYYVEISKLEGVLEELKKG